MKTVFILIMLWGGDTSQSGMTTIQQEFNSFAACESARKVLARAHNNKSGMTLRAQGCFPK